MGTIMPELGMDVNASLLFKRADRKLKATNAVVDR
jgi:hypothetical protein